MQIIYLNPVRKQVWCQDVSNVQVTAAQVKELRGRSGSNDHLLHLLKCQGKFARKCNLNLVNRFLALLPQIGFFAESVRDFSFCIEGGFVPFVSICANVGRSRNPGCQESPG